MVADDSQLIDRALAGQSAAFGELVLRYQDRLYNTLASTLGCAEEARDVAQEAFVQAYLKLETFQRNAAFYTWLYRIAFNVSVSRRRRQRPTQSVEAVREQAGEEPLDRAGAPADRLEQQERAAQVQAALAQLSEDHRTVLVLREIEGFCYETIAETLDVPVGTVRSRLRRARLQLREHLREVLQEDVK
ncbi:MAG: sigma-70 family RNA polymerase sigma factor [Pirellulales bacterium]